MGIESTSSSSRSKAEHSSTSRDEDRQSLLSSTARGAYYLIALQFASRMLTFALHQIVLRYTTAETLGIASVKLELLLSTILFISREGFRCALLRGGDNNNHGSFSGTDEDKGDETYVAENTAAGAEQKVTNLAYVPTIIGLAASCVACGYYLSMIDEVAATQYPYYRTSVILYGVAAFAELLVEPLFVLAMNRLYYQLRVRVEGAAVLLRCFITFGLTLLGAYQADKDGSYRNAYGVLAFAVAQLVFGLTMAFGYAGFFLKQVKRGEIDARSLYPRKLITSDKRRTYWFDTELRNLASTLTKQSLLKHVLTEGDKMLVSALSSDAAQGVYAFVVNYGSLIVRILFQPLEEASRTFFTKLLVNDTGKPSSENVTVAADVLLLIMRFHVMLGLVFTCFATNYTATLIDLLVGKEWSVHSNAPAVLATYCLYVPVMGINGITEAFVQAVATKSDLTKLSYYMVAFSACFMAAGYIFMKILDLGATGLVFANMVNLGIRIIYSWRYIVRYFQSVSQLTERKMLRVREWFPSALTMLAFVVSWMITRWSENSIGWYTLNQKSIHVGIGGLCFLAVLGITAWRENKWIQDAKRLMKKQKTD